MITPKTKRHLQLASAILLTFSICPYLYVLLSIEPVYAFAQQGGNALLQLFIPLCLTGLLGFVAFLLLVISLLRDKSGKIDT
jgi:hypothetical protein